jgi:hypothetical protein
MSIPGRSADLSHLATFWRPDAGPFIFAVMSNTLPKGVEMIVNTRLAGKFFSDGGDSSVVILGRPSTEPSHGSSHHAAASRE